MSIAVSANHGGGVAQRKSFWHIRGHCNIRNDLTSCSGSSPIGPVAIELIRFAILAWLVVTTCLSCAVLRSYHFLAYVTAC